MKRDGNIASLFQKHEAKRKAAAAAATSNRSSDPVVPVVEEQTRERVVEEIETHILAPPPPPPPQPSSVPPVYDINRLPQDPGEKALLKHLGSKSHIAAQERYIGFTIPKVAIDYNIQKWSDEDLRLYKKRLAFRGHDESKESSNRGNFIELLKFLAGNSEEVNKYVLENAPADESSDISHKEQLALCLRYVDKLGRPCEHFIGVIHVDDTTSLSLKNAIEALLLSHGLSLTQIRGQGYDGASNMKGDIKGLKTLIMQESPSAYYIHCFAHQLQLVLVAVAKGNTDCSFFFDQVSILLNIVGVSCKRHDMLRNARLENVKKALDCGEIESGTGLHQEMGLPRPGDTRWGSHYKTICSIITMYESIHDVLVDLGDDSTYKDDWTKIHFVTGAFETFEFVFFAHLMYIILGYTNELSECLQRREQDILNAVSLVNVAKKRMQELRSNGWDNFLERVTSFCDKHGVDVPAMDGDYVPYGKSARKSRARKQTNDDHFRREVYIGVIDQISQELDNRFDEINMELMSCMAAFNPSNSFESFDAQKLRRLAKFYPKDFSNNNLLRLELQLDNYIDDIRKDDRFKGLDNIVDLSFKLVQTKRHKVYDMVYELLKLVLLLPVATASV
nr:zinc finger MYM-type protein 1-like [Setaria viridis]